MNADQIDKILAELELRTADDPNTGIAVCIVTNDAAEDSTRRQVRTVNLTPEHYVALASAFLKAAMTRMSALPDPPRDLIAKCHQARAALDFEEMIANG